MSLWGRFSKRKSVAFGTQVERKEKERSKKMAIRIVREDGDEILRKKSKEVEEVNDKIKQILDDMVETMHYYNGVGLSAPQIGLLKRLVVIDLYDDKGPIKLVNPKILKQEGKQEVEEGCLSFPNQFAKIIRPEKVTMEALDENGKKIKIKAEGLLAQAICHEIDHLEGILFVDKIIPGTLQYVEPEEKKRNERKAVQ